MKKLFCILACAALFAACDNSGSGGEVNTPVQPDLVFGVMSDTHIGATSLSGLTPEARLREAYENFTKLNPSLDAIVTVGDFTDDGKAASYNKYKEIMDEYSTAKNNLLAMGNHDNMDVNGDTAEQRFKDTFGFDATQDKVINGYHFITVSTRDSQYNTTTYAANKEWLTGKLDAAKAESSTKPIFVFTHHTMKATGLLGAKQAEAVGDGDLYDLLSQYPQVVIFSGHSHVPVADPRNIWQGNYTALNCGSVLYTALDGTHDLTKGSMDNAVGVGDGVYAPMNRGESSTALLLSVKGTVVTVTRMDLYWGIIIPTKFVFDTSADKAEFPYLEEKRKNASVAPEFALGAAIKLGKIMDNGFEYTFPQAMTNNSIMPDDGAFAYEVSITNQGSEVDTARLQAEYFMLPRPLTLTYETTKLKPETFYEISIVPVGYFGKKGSALTGTFQTAKAGEGDGPTVYPIVIASLPQAAMIPAGGIPMDTLLNALYTGASVQLVNMMFGNGGNVLFKDAALTQPFVGTDMVTPGMTIYSLADLLSLLS